MIPRVDCQQPATVLCHHKYNWRVILDRVLPLVLCRSVMYFAVNLNVYLMRTITAFVCRCVPPKCSSSSYLDPAPTGWVQRFLSQRGKWGRPSFPRGNEVASESARKMRSPLVPDQKCSECERVHCAVFRHSASTVYYSSCNLPSCQGQAFHWLGEKFPIQRGNEVVPRSWLNISP